MGGWKLESGKMALYISFPVILFYVFNQPKYFEDWVIQKRKDLFPPENETNTKLLQDFKKKYNVKKEEELLKKLSGSNEER
ncbi:UNVERIFIED_CONTAM: hypothetical protein RMT77_015381 [Armadillidium vulgare]